MKKKSEIERHRRRDELIASVAQAQTGIAEESAPVFTPDDLRALIREELQSGFSVLHDGLRTELQAGLQKIASQFDAHKGPMV